MLRLLFFGLPMLVGCGEEPVDPVAHQLAHCRAAMSWMTKDMGATEVVGERHWDQGDSRNVGIDFILTLNEESGGRAAGTKMRDVFQCRYDLNKTGTGPDGPYWAEAMSMRGIALSEKQVLTLNRMIGVLGTGVGRKPQ